MENAKRNDMEPISDFRLLINHAPDFYCRGLPLITYAPRERGGGSSLLYISITYYMQKGGEGVQKACKNVYVINGRPRTYPAKNRFVESLHLKQIIFF